MKVDLKGIFKVNAKSHTYYYAWRGGPRLRGEPGSPEFIASYNEAIENRRTPDKGRFKFAITDYKSSESYRKLASSTQRNWSRMLDRIEEGFGDLRIAVFDCPEKIRPHIRRWRNQWVDRPRTADYAMQVLSRVLSHAVDPLGKIASNPCEGIKQLYSGDRSEIIWTDTDIATLKATCALEIAHAVDLAAHTGLRLSDLLRLSWSHVGDDAIKVTTGKSRHRREAIIPLYDALRSVLETIPKRATTILTNSRQRPWTVNGFGTAFNRAKIDAGFSVPKKKAGASKADKAAEAAAANARDLHFHDLRGTAATRFYIAGLSVRVIAEVMGWEEEYVEKIIWRYVGRNAATKAAIRQLNQASRAGTGT